MCASWKEVEAGKFTSLGLGSSLLEKYKEALGNDRS